MVGVGVSCSSLQCLVCVEGSWVVVAHMVVCSDWRQTLQLVLGEWPLVVGVVVVLLAVLR